MVSLTSKPKNGIGPVSCLHRPIHGILQEVLLEIIVQFFVCASHRRLCDGCILYWWQQSTTV